MDIYKIIYNLLQNNGNEEEIINIIKKQKDFNVNYINDNNISLVELIIIKNNIKLLFFLLSYDIKFDIITSEYVSIMYYPIKYFNNEILKLIISKDNIGVPIYNFMDRKLRNSIYYCAFIGNYEATQILLNVNVNVNVIDIDNNTPLHIALIFGHELIAFDLIKHTKLLNHQNNKGETVLHLAVMKNMYNVIKELIKYNVNINIPEYKNEMTPIYYTLLNSNNKIRNLLLDNGADINYQDKKGKTILHYLADEKLYNIIIDIVNIRKLYCNKIISEDMHDSPISIEYICDITDIYGNTLLHILLNNNADISYIKTFINSTSLIIQNNEGDTCLHLLLKYYNFKDFEEHLKKIKLNIYIKNNNNVSPIDYIKLIDRNSFIDIVVNSYLNQITENSKLYDICYSKKMMDKCFEEIKKDIVINNISFPNKYIKPITFIKTEKTDITTFTGNIIDLHTGLFYLKSKFNILDFYISSKNRDEKLYNYINSNGYPYDILYDVFFMEIIWIHQTLFYPINFIENIKTILDNSKIQVIVIPINIILSNGNHSNFLIYYRSTNIIERFEPHGHAYPYHFNYNPSLLDNLLNNMFSSIIKSVIYHKPYDFLPRLGFLNIDSHEPEEYIGDPIGFCAIWCIWYLDHRLENINLSSKELIDILFEKIRESHLSFKQTIRNYSKIITTFRDKYLKKYNLTINDINNKKYDINTINNILNDLKKIN